MKMIVISAKTNISQSRGNSRGALFYIYKRKFLCRMSSLIFYIYYITKIFLAQLKFFGKPFQEEHPSCALRLPPCYTLLRNIRRTAEYSLQKP